MRKLETKEPIPFLTGRHIRAHTSSLLFTEGHLTADDEVKVVQLLVITHRAVGMITCVSMEHMPTTLTHWLALTMSHIGPTLHETVPQSPYKITDLVATRLLS